MSPFERLYCTRRYATSPDVSLEPSSVYVQSPQSQQPFLDRLEALARLLRNDYIMEGYAQNFLLGVTCGAGSQGRARMSQGTSAPIPLLPDYNRPHMCTKRSSSAGHGGARGSLHHRQNRCFV